MAKIMTSSDKRGVRAKAFQAVELKSSGAKQFVSQGSGDVARAIGEVGNQFEEEAAHNEITALNTRISKKRNDFMYGEDGKGGFTSLKGKAAMEAFDSHKEDMQKFVDDEVGGMSNMASTKAARVGENAVVEHTAQLNKVAGAEYEKYQDFTFKDALEQEVSNAQLRYATFGTDEIKTATNRMKILVKGFAKRKGLDAKQTKKLAQAQYSEVHKAVVTQSLNNNNPALAEVNYRQAINSGQLNGETRAYLDKVMSRSNSEMEVQGEVDELMIRYEGGEGGHDIMKEISKKYSGEQERAMKQEFKNRQSEYKVQKSEDAQRSTDKYLTEIEANGWNLSELSTEDKDALEQDPKKKKALESFIALRKKETDIQTDPVFLADLRERLTNPVTRAKTLQEDSINYLTKLSNAKYQDIIKMKESLRSGKNEKEWGHKWSDTSLMRTEANRLGLKKGDRATFENHVMDQAELWEREHKKNIPNTEFKAIMDRANTQITTGTFGFGGKKAYEIDTDLKGIPQTILDEIEKSHPNASTLVKRDLAIKTFRRKQQIRARESAKIKQQTTTQHATVGKSSNFFAGVGANTVEGNN